MLATAALRAISTRTIRTSRCAAAVAALAMLAVPAAAAASPTGPAGGDLSGTYPNPEIAASAVGSPELAGNAITHDTSVLNSAFGNFTSKIGEGAIGSHEIAAGQVQAEELGGIVLRSAYETVAPGDSGGVTAYCLPGERVISGGGAWTKQADFNMYLYRSSPYNIIEGWHVSGVNGSKAVTGTLRADAMCLG